MVHKGRVEGRGEGADFLNHHDEMNIKTTWKGLCVCGGGGGGGEYCCDGTCT